jgi:LysM repeat protein
MSEELNLNEMEQVNGGTGGSPTPLPPKSGCEVYKIKSGQTLSGIAQSYGTTWRYLMSINVGIISNENDITAGRYIYVPKR